MPNLICMERDIRYFADLGEYGVLDAELSYHRHFAAVSRERCRQRLALYAQHRLVYAAKLQVWYSDQARGRGLPGGKIPTLFALTPLGAEAVHRCTGLYPRRVLRSDPPTPATFFHRLHIVRVRAALDTALATAALPPALWVMEQDQNPQAAPKTPVHRRRFLSHVFAGEQGTITCQPDAAALLTIPQPPGSIALPTSVAAFFEIDLSSEGLVQVRKKIDGYAALLEELIFPYWPPLTSPLVRVFWVVYSVKRLRELTAALRDCSVADRFRFTTFAHCDHRILTEPVWQDVHGAPKTIYRSPLAASG